ncbi:MAG: hypothetical protein N2037_02300 [Acidimicrobiales bacterium]|nr:hypothetical protein [Acidimicrobiales bacterium]
MADDETPEEALAALRRARRLNHRRNIHWVDALYNVYITAFISIGVVLYASTLFPNDKLDAADAADLANRGPAWLGLAIALAVGFGLRSGARGGPLTLEAPVVHHELMAPIDRGAALRPIAFRQLRFVAYAGALLGGIVGVLASHRIPANPVLTTACTMASFALAGVLATGAALMISGRRLGVWWANFIALVIIAWSVVDLTLGWRSSPLTMFASMAFWEIRFDPAGLVGPVLTAAIVVAGLAPIGNVSIEASRRRSGLVSQLRFAVTLQDMRTVVLLRRQLAEETPRSRPWLRIGGRPSRLFPTWRRDWQGYLRFPLVRIGRMVALAAVAGVSFGLTWRGITPAFILAALALFVAAYEAAEPLAQEVDHPSRWLGAPEDPGLLLLKHLPAAFVVMLVECLVAAAVALLLVPPEVVGSLLLIELVPVAGAAAVAGAAGTVVGTPGPMSDIQGGMTGMSGVGDGLGGDIVGYQSIARLVLPPAVVLVAVAPMLAVGSDPNAPDTTRVSNLVSFSLLVTMAAVGYVRTRRPSKA